jgi:hypothetical protein
MRSEALQIARINVIPVLEDRHKGLSCRAIAEKHELPEYAIWQIMKETGYAGKMRARPVQPKRRKKIQPADVLRTFEQIGEELVIERSADDTGWIVTIDDLSGQQEETIADAILSAWSAWQKSL